MVSLRKQTPCLSLTHGDSDSACFLVFLRREDRFINNGASYLFQLDTIPGCQTPNAGSLSQKHTISPPLSSFPLSTQDGWCLWMHTFIYPWCNLLQKKNKNCPPPPPPPPTPHTHTHTTGATHTQPNERHKAEQQLSTNSESS